MTVGNDAAFAHIAAHSSSTLLFATGVVTNRNGEPTYRELSTVQRLSSAYKELSMRQDVTNNGDYNEIQLRKSVSPPYGLPPAPPTLTKSYNVLPARRDPNAYDLPPTESTRVARATTDAPAERGYDSFATEVILSPSKE
jgi:hypothetical protein